MALEQISNIMAQQNDSVYVYVKDYFSHATISRATKAPSIVFKRSNGEDIKTYTPYTWFDNFGVRGTYYSYSHTDGYQDAQKFINSIVQQPVVEASITSGLRRFSLNTALNNNTITADEEELNRKDENNYKSTK